MIASGQGALSALKTGCAGLVVALVLAVMLGQGVRTPVHACCYDPPENDSASDQALPRLLLRMPRRLRQPHQGIYLPDLTHLQIQMKILRHLRRVLP